MRISKITLLAATLMMAITPAVCVAERISIRCTYSDGSGGTVVSFDPSDMKKSTISDGNDFQHGVITPAGIVHMYTVSSPQYKEYEYFKTRSYFMHSWQIVRSTGDAVVKTSLCSAKLNSQGYTIESTSKCDPSDTRNMICKKIEGTAF